MDPSNHTVKIGPQHDIMFGIWITETSLNQAPKLFDVMLLEQHFEPGTDLSHEK